MLVKLIVAIAKAIHGNRRYHHIKSGFDSLLNSPTNPYRIAIDFFMMGLVVSSVALLVYGVDHQLPLWLEYYDLYVVSAIFLIEYLLRLWLSSHMHQQVLQEAERAEYLGYRLKLFPLLFVLLKSKLNYITSPAAIVDLLAILPAYRPLRVLRFFVLFRFFKLLRYAKSINEFVDVLLSKRFELYTLFVLLLFIVVASGVAIYIFERHANSNIETIFDALYWALVTISTVGYGDISPVTPQGRAVSVLIILSGIAMISFVTSVVVSAFSERLDELKQTRLIENARGKKELTLVCGFGSMARLYLKHNPQINSLIVDRDPLQVKKALEMGYEAVCADASSSKFLSSLVQSNSSITLLAISGSDMENVSIVLNGRTLSSSIYIIARASNESLHKRLQLAGANEVLTPSLIATKMLIASMHHRVLFEGISKLIVRSSEALIDELLIGKNSSLLHKRVDEVDFRSSKLLLMALYCKSQDRLLYEPKGDYELQEGDILVVLGRAMAVEYMQAQLGGKDE